MSRPTVHRHHLAVVLTFVLTMLSLVLCASQLAQTGGAQTLPLESPLLTRAAIQHVPGTMLVTGEHFTPGGAVYVGFYDAWGMQLLEPRWVTASATVYGPDGSQDPALGFIRGGTINEVFGADYVVYGPNGSQDPARGFRRIDASLEVQSTSAVYGPDGSQDPARGYVPAGAQREIVGNLCGDAVMIRALDAETGAWSNVLDSRPAC
jgi:hypothetical protein